MTSSKADATLLNESHERHLLASCQHIDSLLSEIEAILATSESNSAFPKYRNDLTPVKAKVARDHLARIRRQMIRSLKSVGVTPPEPSFGAIHSMRVALMFADITIEECTPSRMAGYGGLSPEAAPVLNGLVEEIKGSISQLTAFLNQGEGQDFNTRLDRLQDHAAQANIIRVLDRVIDRQGLVEFRPALTAILDRMEHRQLEIAFFGRVSSGKSSLLNHVLGTALLPVGVTPVTAVPTRIEWGETPSLKVSLAHKSSEILPISKLPEFATEAGNPANRLRVTKLTVALPSPILQTGITFVDTPGLGSLASAGAAETLTYLPRCDLGVVLVDCASTLTENDLATMRSLIQGAITVKVVLSKADLLRPADIESSITYTASQIKNELGLDVDVHAVSSIPGSDQLLDDWFEQAIHPLAQQQATLARESLSKKVDLLSQQLKTALGARLNRTTTVSGLSAVQINAAEAVLRTAAGQFESARKECLAIVDRMNASSRAVLHRLAEAATTTREANAVEIDGAWVGAMLVQDGARDAAPITSSLQTLVREAVKGLREVAATLGVSGAPSEEEFLSLLRDMPMLDPGALDFKVKVGYSARAFPFLMRHQIESRLHDAIGQQLSLMYSVFQTRLVSWIRNAIADIRRQFETYAEVYRAQLSSPGNRSSRPPDEAPQLSITRDLQEIQDALEGVA